MDGICGNANDRGSPASDPDTVGYQVVPLHFLGIEGMINSGSDFWLAEPVYTSHDYEIRTERLRKMRFECS